MKELVREVLNLQPYWSHKNTTEMQRRGILVRREIPEWIRRRLSKVSKTMGVAGRDLRVNGRDGTGPKNEIPWIRINSASRSPTAQLGWYCVYLFRADGAGVYLCLGQGATRNVDGEFRPRPASELNARVNWARSLLNVRLKTMEKISQTIELAARGSLGPAYENGTVCSIFYSSTALPAPSVFEADLKKFLELLATVYNAEDTGRSLDAVERESEDTQSAVEEVASPSKAKRSGQGFGLTLAERIAVERQAMAQAQHYLEENGFEVKDVSRNHPYDFLATKAGASVIVEVKGTTGGLSTIILTANEVLIHQQSHPANVLIVVHSIGLDRSGSTPQTSPGILHTISPWTVDPKCLRPLSFQYVILN